MIVKLLTEHHLEFLSLKGGSRGSSESTLVKMSNCWKSHVAAHLENGVDSDQLATSHCFLGGNGELITHKCNHATDMEENRHGFGI